jgi:Kdo2-lipid IVA lauroyltransferase/acyltransferase
MDWFLGKWFAGRKRASITSGEYSSHWRNHKPRNPAEKLLCRPAGFGRMRKRLRYGWCMSSLKLRFIIALIRAIGLLPLAVNRRLGALLGWLSYRVNGRNAQVTRTNIDLCLPHLAPSEKEQLAKQSLIETGKLASETCFLWHPRFTDFSPLITAIDGEHLPKQALARGKGLLILAPHLGNWEILGMYLGTLGQTTNLYQPPKQPELEPLILAGRHKSGAQLVPTNARGVAALLKTLKENGISGILPDQNPNDPSGGLVAPFFGHPALTMVLAQKLRQRTDCAVLFAFAKRVEHGFYLIFREPPADLYSDDPSLAIAALNRGVEALVLEAPAQYQWEYKRFKEMSPEGKPYY